MPVEEGQSPQIHLDAAPGVVLHHPGKVGFELSGAQVVWTAFEESCNAAHCSGIAIDCFAPLALQPEGLQVLGIELVESLLFMLFHAVLPLEGSKDMTRRYGRVASTVDLGDQAAMQAAPAARCVRVSIDQHHGNLKRLSYSGFESAAQRLSPTPPCT